jgi:tRNA (guanine-N7-)-methyltransferase
MNDFGVDFKEICLDLHKAYDKDTLFMTEFEERFSKEGPIYKLTATFKEETKHEENL